MTKTIRLEAASGQVSRLSTEFLASIPGVREAVIKKWRLLPRKKTYIVVSGNRVVHRCDSPGEALAFAHGRGEGMVFVDSKYQVEH